MLPSILLFFAWLLDIVLRVPPLFVMDIILKSPYSFTLDLTASCVYVSSYVFDVLRFRRFHTGQVSIMYFALVILHSLGFSLAMFSFLLPTKQLVSIYLTVASGAVLFWSYVMNEEYIKYCVNLIIIGKSLQNELFSLNRTALQMFFGNYFSQAFWAIIFCFSSANLRSFPPKKLVAGLTFIFPTLISVLPLPQSVLSSMPTLALCVEVSCFAFYLAKRHRLVYSAMISPVRYFSALIGSYGLPHFLIYHWRHIEVSQVFRVFWLIRTAKHAVYLLHDSGHLVFERNTVFMLSKKDIFVIVEDLIPESCDTFLAVLGLACTLTSVIVYVVRCIRRLLGVPADARQNLAPVISVLFILLAMQTGLTGLEPKERLLKVYRNSLLMLAAVSHNILEDVHTTLIFLSASRNTSVSRHLRAVGGGIVLMVYSAFLLAFLVTKHAFSAWLLTASAFNVEVLIKVTLSFLVYALNLIDTWSNTMWENFDDYIFFVTSADHVTSFLFNLFLFFNACYILLYESVGVTRIILMLIHLHCNIWSQIESGWVLYRKRQFASKLVKSLHVATDEELHAFDDVCSICHQILQSAVITGCNHFFHSICLKKWLHEQNTCPFCHKHLLLDSEQRQPQDLQQDHEHQE